LSGVRAYIQGIEEDKAMRCPTEKGGCGENVWYLFDSGLCVVCDARAAEARKSAPPPPPKPRGKPFTKNPVPKE